MSSTHERHDVVIAGGGIAGLALACTLADALGPGARIAVADRSSLRPGAASTDARAFALAAGPKRMLTELGALVGNRAACPARHGRRHHGLEPR